MNQPPRIPPKTDSRAMDVIIIVGCAVFLCWPLYCLIETQLPLTRTSLLIKALERHRGFAYDRQPTPITAERASSVQMTEVRTIYLDKVDSASPRLLRAIADLPNLETLSVSKSISESYHFKQLFLTEDSSVQIQVHYRMDEVPMRKIDSVEAFQRASDSNCLVLFIDCDWSFYTAPARPIVSELVERWRVETPSAKVTFARVDFSEFDSRLWATVQDWLNRHKVGCGGYKTYGCVGRILWIRKNVIVDHDWAYARSANSLIRKTRRILSTDPS